MKVNKKMNYTSFTHKDFSSVLHKYNYQLNVGDIVAGKIFNQEKHGFLVEIGVKISAYLPQEETSLNKQTQVNIINETREFFILAYNKHLDQLIISIKRLEYIRAWARIKQMHEEDIILELYTISANKGGLIVKVEGIQGFIPNSHLLNTKNRKSLLNKYLKCKFLIVDEKYNQLVFSHRCAMLSIYGSKLQVGQIVNSTIIDIQSYGIFITINQIPTLLHISEISNKHIKNIHNNFYIGEKIQVKIMHVDKKQGRLYVSRRNLY